MISLLSSLSMFCLLTRRKTIGAEMLYNVVCHSAPAICSYENGLTSSKRVSSKVRRYSCSLSDACGFRDPESSLAVKIFETSLKPLFLLPKIFCSSNALNRQPISTWFGKSTLTLCRKRTKSLWLLQFFWGVSGVLRILGSSESL